RIFTQSGTSILMDSSLEKSSLVHFLKIQQRLLNARVRVPQVFESSLELGFVLLEDFGSTHLLDILDEENQKLYYKKAIDEIVQIQQADATGLLVYDREFLIFEMDLSIEWYLKKHLGVVLDSKAKVELQSLFGLIADDVLLQPQGVFVHRDFHSRNIMLDANGKLGVIDFQDARSGAITYDLVSLLKDCYYEIGLEAREELVLYFRDKKGLDADDKTILRWFDMMGLQRHIKILGIFTRLCYRDKKRQYLQDIPLTLRYIKEVALKYPALKALDKLLMVN
ncbi:MAG TPA: aminoglycoside phosphotransferase, partial [Epsilonproteobacteria bacterium]|nr:aminoglycoside phosphotransferase [Campylobacterota bacterium]